jgi:hypothetical protein
MQGVRCFAQSRNSIRADRSEACAFDVGQSDSQPGDRAMNNCKELRGELSNVFSALRTGLIKPHEASELANVAGKMIASAKVQVAYYDLRGEQPSIGFLDEPKV